MRILLATFWAYPHIGGVSRHVQSLKEALEAQGHEVDLLAQLPDYTGFYMPHLQRKFEKSCVEALVQKKVNHIFNEKLPFIDPYVIKQEIERTHFELAALFFGLEEYDIIHAHDVISARALANIKPESTPLILSMHGSLSFEYLTFGRTALPYESDIWHYQMFREDLGAHSSDSVIVPSKWLKNILMKTFKVPLNKIYVVPYGIKVHEFKKTLDKGTEMKVPKDKKIIICPARLDAVKGHSYLLHALAKLKEDRQDWLCWIVGGGYLREELEEKCQAMELTEYVVFLGERKDVAGLLSVSDIMVLPSLQDNQPFSIIEAQIAGKAIVTTDAGGIPNMVSHGKTGLVSASGFIEPLYENILRLLEDEQLRKQLGQEAQKYGKRRWRLNTMLQRINRIYHTVLNQRASLDDQKLRLKNNIEIQLPKNYPWIDKKMVQKFIEQHYSASQRVKSKTKPNIGILGSCVSRDIFEYFPNTFNIGPVFSRTSLISLMSPPLAISQNEIHLTSDWQKRMVLFDFQKNFWDSLSRHYLDYLIIDFIDERFDLCYCNHSYITRSHEFVESGIEKSGKYNFQLINRFDPVTNEMWKWFCDLFIHKLMTFLPAHKVILHKAPWMSSFRSNGELLPFEAQEWIQMNNDLLKQYYEYFESKWTGIHTIDLSDGGFHSDANHIWGLQPYHYEDGYYLKAGERIKMIAGIQ